MASPPNYTPVVKCLFCDHGLQTCPSPVVSESCLEEEDGRRVGLLGAAEHVVAPVAPPCTSLADFTAPGLRATLPISAYQSPSRSAALSVQDVHGLMKSCETTGASLQVLCVAVTDMLQPSACTDVVTLAAFHDGHEFHIRVAVRDLDVVNIGFGDDGAVNGEEPTGESPEFAPVSWPVFVEECHLHKTGMRAASGGQSGLLCGTLADTQCVALASYGCSHAASEEQLTAIGDRKKSMSSRVADM